MNFLRIRLGGFRIENLRLNPNPARKTVDANIFKKSHQPSGLRWFRVFYLYLPFPSSLGEGFTPPPTPALDNPPPE